MGKTCSFIKKLPASGIATLTLFVALAAVPQACLSTPLSIEDNLNARQFASFQEPVLSPSGNLLAFSVCSRQVTSTGPSYDCQIIVRDIARRVDRQISEGPGVKSELVWSPSGRILAYVAQIGSETRVFTTNLSSPVRDLGRTRSYSLLRWLDEDHLAFFDDPGQTVNPIKDPLLQKSAIAGSTATIYRSSEALTEDERSALRGSVTDAPTWTYPLSNLIALDIRNGDRRVLAKSVAGTILAPTSDGKKIVFTKWIGAASNHSQQQVFDIETVPADGSQPPTTVRAGVQQYVGVNVSWSPDGRYLAWLTSGEQASGQCFIFDSRTGSIVSPPQVHPSFDPMTSNPAFATPVWLDSKHLIFRAHQAVGEAAYYAPNELWTVDAESGTARKLASIAGTKFNQIVTRDNVSQAFVEGGAIVVLAEDVDTYDDSLIKVSLADGRASTLVGGKYKINEVRGSPDSSFISFVRQAADVSPDAWLLNARTNNVTRLTQLNPFFEKIALGKASLIRYRLPNGTVGRAALMLPALRAAKQRVPLVIYAYGSINRSANIHNFGFGEVPFGDPTENMQLLATRGYAVLLPDVPIRVGSPMKDIADDVIASANAAVDQGYADKARLGIMGHSYGGYTVYSVIVSTTMFKAAVARSGFSDWLITYGEMGADGSAYSVNLAEMTSQGYGVGASPWAAPDLYTQNSPFRFFDRVKTPLLITQGADDYAVNPYSAESSFVALRRLGKDVELALYSGEGHTEESWSEANQQDYLERMIGWFDRYLCPERLGDPERNCKATP